MARTPWWRRYPAALAVGAVLLAGTALTAGEPYRYCQPPSGHGAIQPPATLDHNIHVVNGQSPPIDDATGEQPPQAQLVAPLGAFEVPTGAVTVRVVIACAPSPTVLPPDGTLDGNVYSFTVSAGGAPLSLAPGQQARVSLRGPAGTPNPVLERFESGLWTRLQTGRVASLPDTYTATVDELAEVALVVSNATVPATSDDHTGLILAVLAIALALFAAGSLVVMRGRAGSGRRGADS
jgi:hypothetical protein